MATFVEAALHILRDAKRPMHYREITDLAIERALITTEGRTPEQTMRVTLTQASRLPNPTIRAHGAGRFSAVPAPAGRARGGEKRDPGGSDPDEPATSDNRYVGMAGEHRVASELFLRNYNASITRVDEGIDLVAIRGQRLAYIQVKTSNRRGNRHISDLSIKAYEKNQLENVYYVFVLLGGDRTRFLVLPYHELTKQIRQGNLNTINKGSRYRAVITWHGEKVSLGRVSNDVTYWLDNWDTLTSAGRDRRAASRRAG